MLNAFELHSNQLAKSHRLCASANPNRLNSEYQHDDGLEMVSSPSSAGSLDDSIIECTDVPECRKNKLNHSAQSCFSPWTSPLSSYNATPTYTFGRQSLSSDEGISQCLNSVNSSSTRRKSSDLFVPGYREEEIILEDDAPSGLEMMDYTDCKMKSRPCLLSGNGYCTGSCDSHPSASNKPNLIPHPTKMLKSVDGNLRHVRIHDNKRTDNNDRRDASSSYETSLNNISIIAEPSSSHASLNKYAPTSNASDKDLENDSARQVRSTGNAYSQFKELDFNLKADLIMQSKMKDPAVGAMAKSSSLSPPVQQVSRQPSPKTVVQDANKAVKSIDRFDWDAYLTQTKSIAAPAECFENPFPLSKNQFKVGMCLEGRDPLNTAIISVLSVSEVLGHRIRLHFDGYDACYDFWRNCDSEFIYPVGYCEQNGFILMPPAGTEPNRFKWSEYLKDKIEAPKSLFANNRIRKTPTRNFEVGMKLEVVDKRNPILIRVATIVDINNRKLRIHYDDWSSIYDIWMEKDSEDIHPVTWCEKTNHPLSSSNRETFVFNRTNYNYSVNCPIAGCEGIGHIKGPKYTNHHTESGCPYAPRYLNKDVIGDRFSEQQPSNNIKKSNKPSHTLDSSVAKKPVLSKHKQPKLFKRDDQVKTSTTSDQIKKGDSVRDTLISRVKAEKAKADISKSLVNGAVHMQDLANSKLVKPRGRPPKGIPPFKINDENEYKIDKSTLQYLLLLNNVHESVYLINTDENNPDTNPDLLEFNYDLNLLPGFHEYFQCLKKKKKIIPTWSKDDVANFIKMIPGCTQEAEKFIQQEIDGEALLLIQQHDLIKLMKLKIGPAVKIFNYILMLKNLSVS